MQLTKEEIKKRASIFSTDEDKLEAFYRLLVENRESSILESIFGNTQKERDIASSDLSTLVIGLIVTKQIKEIISKLDMLIVEIEKVKGEVSKLKKQVKE